MTLPLFKSHYSIGKSILTLEKAGDISEVEPVSIFSIAKKHGLKEVILVEDSLSGFLQAHANAKDIGAKLIFGLRITVTEDISDKSPDSLKKEYKIIIFAKNAEGYKKLIKISTIASCDGFYYVPRIDLNILRKYYSDDLMIALPFYDSFLYNNSFYGHLCVPDLEVFNPTFFIEDNDLPFDDLLKDKVIKYVKDKYNIIKAQSIYYYQRKDFLAYLTFKCINNRSNLNKPNFDHMASDSFCFENI